jgi:hypothetical protein
MPIYVNTASDEKKETATVAILGYGTQEQPELGPVIRIEVERGQSPKVKVFSDISSKEPTHVIDLSAAATEKAEKPKPVAKPVEPAKKLEK